MSGRDLIERVRKALRDRYSVIAAVGRGGNACIFSGRDASSANDRVTLRGVVVGTEEYMGTEQVVGAPDGDGRTDLYALGVVLFECLAGRPPFTSVSAAAVLDMHQHRPAPAVRSVRRDVPKELAALVARALVKPRAERWQRARDMRDPLARFVAAG